jgi:hypothetical protein
MLSNLSELLSSPERIAYNIMGDEKHAQSDLTFGFQFFNKEA